MAENGGGGGGGEEIKLLFKMFRSLNLQLG